jgi:hypothetical protein
LWVAKGSASIVVSASVGNKSLRNPPLLISPIIGDHLIKTKMTHKTILTAAIIFLTCLTLWTCNKEKVSCSDDQTFCSLVDNQDFDATGTIIDNYLAGLEKNKKDENLEKLRDWLECKSCVDKAEIICNSCIYTLPPQSELRVDFNSNGKTVTMTLDILMDEPLKFRAYH